MVSDGAAYCSKAYRDALKGLFPNAVHFICNAHILSLVSEQWRSEFEEVDLFCTRMKRVFAHSVARRRRFKEHLESEGCTEISNPPTPVITRWTSWYQAVAYHSSHFEYYKSFFTAEEEDHGSAVVRQILQQLDSLFLHQEVAFITKKM